VDPSGEIFLKNQRENGAMTSSNDNFFKTIANYSVFPERWIAVHERN